MNFVKSIGGEEEGDAIRRAFIAVISDEVAIKFSWSGQKNTKRKFKNLTICTLLIGKNL